MHYTTHTADSVNENAVRFLDHDNTGLTGASIVRTTDSSAISGQRDSGRVETTQTSPPLNRPETVKTVDDAVLPISGAGHWFLEGWIGDHLVPRRFGIVGDGYVRLSISDFGLCWSTSGSVSMYFKTLRGANGTGIGVSGCSHCVVSFMGLLTEFPILVCDLASGTDAIMGTDVLRSVLPHTQDIKNGLLFTDGDASLQLHRRDAALSGRVFTVGHCSVPPYSV